MKLTIYTVNAEYTVTLTIPVTLNLVHKHYYSDFSGTPHYFLRWMNPLLVCLIVLIPLQRYTLALYVQHIFIVPCKLQPIHIRLRLV